MSNGLSSLNQHSTQSVFKKVTCPACDTICSWKTRKIIVIYFNDGVAQGWEEHPRVSRAVMSVRVPVRPKPAPMTSRLDIFENKEEKQKQTNKQTNKQKRIDHVKLTSTLHTNTNGTIQNNNKQDVASFVGGYSCSICFNKAAAWDSSSSSDPAFFLLFFFSFPFDSYASPLFSDWSMSSSTAFSSSPAVERKK